MNSKRFLKATALSVMLSGTLLVNGCSLGIGESEFSCKNIGEGTKCTNSWDIYKMTNNGKSPSEMKKEAKAAKEAEQTRKEAEDKANNLLRNAEVEAKAITYEMKQKAYKC